MEKGTEFQITATGNKSKIKDGLMQRTCKLMEQNDHNAQGDADRASIYVKYTCSTFFCSILYRQKHKIDRVKVLCPIRHKIGLFWRRSPSQCLGLIWRN